MRGLLLGMTVCFGILFMLANFAPAKWRADEWLIVPGTGVGPVRIGMRTDDARSVMARYGRVEARGGSAYYCNPDPIGLCISDVMVFPGFVRRTPDRVAWVNTSDERFHTKEGFRVGTLSPNLLRAYGRPARDEPIQAYYALEWHALGIGILTTSTSRDGPIGSIGVFAPRK